MILNKDYFLKVLKNFLDNIGDNKSHYTGFLDRKTVYKVKDYE